MYVLFVFLQHNAADLSHSNQDLVTRLNRFSFFDHDPINCISCDFRLYGDSYQVTACHYWGERNEPLFSMFLDSWWCWNIHSFVAMSGLQPSFIFDSIRSKRN